MSGERRLSTFCRFHCLKNIHIVAMKNWQSWENVVNYVKVILANL